MHSSTANSMEPPKPTTQPKFELPQRISRKKHRRLAFEKCIFCRTSKQKCLPTGRHWPDKCNRCVERDLPCSEAQRAPRRAHPPIAEVAEVADLQTTLSSGKSESKVNSTTLSRPLSAYSPLPQADNVLHHSGIDQYGLQYERLDVLGAMREIAKMATNQLEIMAKDMARLSDGDPPCDYVVKRLDGAVNKFETFTRCLDQDIDIIGYNIPPFPDLDLFYGNRISRTVDEQIIQDGRRKIDEFSRLRRPGTVYLMRLDQMVRFPSQTTVDDRQEFQKCEALFVSTLERIQGQGQFTPNLVQFASMFLPHLPRGFFTRNPYMIDLLVHKRPIRYLSVNADIVKHDCLGRTPCHVLIDAGSNALWPTAWINHKDILGRTSLYFACRDGYGKQVEKLLQDGAAASNQTITGVSPMHVAASLRHGSICRRIWEQYLDKDLNVHILDQQGGTSNTPLQRAASAGDSDMIRSFCQHFPSAGIPATQDLSSALVLAVRGGHLSVLRVFIQYGFHTNIRDTMGRTPFWHAVHGSHYEIMKALIDIPETELDRKDNDGRTPLAEAARLGNTEAVKFILKISVNDQIAALAASVKGRLKVDINSRDNGGDSPLTLATRNGHKECVSLLLHRQPWIRHEVIAEARSIALDSRCQEVVRALDYFVQNKTLGITGRRPC